jgi:hypothetical protein
MAVQAPDPLPFMPPPSSSVVPYPPVIELPTPADGPAAATPHVAPGLTPGVASSVAPMGIPVCPTGELGLCPTDGPKPSGDVRAGDGLTCASATPLPKRAVAKTATAKRVSKAATFRIVSPNTQLSIPEVQRLHVLAASFS